MAPSALSLRLLLVASAALAAGCPSFSTRGAARTLPQGDTELSVVMSGVSANPLAGMTVEEEGYSGDEGYPQLEVGLGYAVHERVELGARGRLGTWSLFGGTTGFALALDTKVQLRRASTPDRGLDVALGPTFTVGCCMPQSQDTFTLAQLPLLLGLNTGGGSQVLLTPQLTLAAPHRGLSRHQLIPSVGVGYLHRFRSGWGLRPELTVIAPPDAAGRLFASTGLQLGLGLLKH
jgi:hypothetical protein